MSEIFTQSKWIWAGESFVNQYVDFLSFFRSSGRGEILLRISADTDYSLFVNGRFLYAGQYPDYPEYKIFDTFSLSEYCREGENTIAVLCRWAGEDCSTYRTAASGLLFEVTENGKVIAASGADTLFRPDPCYRSGAIENITPQLGHTYYYDARKEDGWIGGRTDGFRPSVPVEKQCILVPRPIERLRYTRSGGELATQGEWIEGTNFSSAAARADGAFFHKKEIEEKSPFPRKFPIDGGYTVKTERDGVYFLVDLCEESAGFLYLDFEVPGEAETIIAFGEHLRDLRVRANVGGRNFAVAYTAHPGRNRWQGSMRRLGGRYLQILIRAPQATIYDAGLMRAEYPAAPRPAPVSDKLWRKIYENGVRTMKLCMHEHYEDCPWREQALYAMDSRNQMLFGYYVFGNEEYARANLRLMSHGLREDGLLELCFPARVGVTIPVFSLYFVIAVSEYFERTEDAAFVREMLPAVRSIMETFRARKEKNGLILAFAEEQYWNFYEWRPGLDAGVIFRDFRLPEQYDSCLNLLYLLTLQKISGCLLAVGEKDFSSEEEQNAFKRAIVSVFYDENEDMFAATLCGGRRSVYAELPQALAVAADCFPEKSERLCSLLRGDGKSVLIPVSLANKPWVYDALLKNVEANLPFVLRDIEKTYGGMVMSGDTTLYETADGAEDFEGAGSLCHGWSAVACYIYQKYAEEIRKL